jgi:hypothetical protein
LTRLAAGAEDERNDFAGKRPFRIHYDPTEDGANVGFTVLDRLRAEMLHRVGLSDLLKPSVLV